MICKKCGNKIRKGHKFCTQCGRKIDSGLSKSKVILLEKEKIFLRLKKIKNHTKEILNSNMQKFKSKKFIVIIGALLILMIVAGVYTASSLVNQPVMVSNVTIGGRYFSLYDNKGYIEFKQEKEQNYDGNYKRIIEAKSIYSMEDKYRVEGNVLILVDSVLRKDNKYLIYKDYLIPTELSFQNTVPNEDTFNVDCSRNNIQYKFKDDGTFTKIEDSIDTGIREISGTYERKGEIITMKAEGEEFKLLIYENKIYDGAYKKDDSQ